MSYRNYGPIAFPVAADFDEDRKVGDLVGITEDGEITNVLEDGVIFLPLVEDVIVENVREDQKTKVAGVQTHAIAKVTVETALNIKAGSDVGVGATGVGAALYTTGFKLGIALATPKGNDDQIPVLLVPSSVATIY